LIIIPKIRNTISRFATHHVISTVIHGAPLTLRMLRSEWRKVKSLLWIMQV